MRERSDALGRRWRFRQRAEALNQLWLTQPETAGQALNLVVACHQRDQTLKFAPALVRGQHRQPVVRQRQLAEFGITGDLQA